MAGFVRKESDTISFYSTKKKISLLKILFHLCLKDEEDDGDYVEEDEDEEDGGAYVSSS